MKTKTLKMRKYVVDVVVVNPTFAVVALGAPTHTREQREIEGYTLKDALRRAGIEG